MILPLPLNVSIGSHEGININPPNGTAVYVPAGGSLKFNCSIVIQEINAHLITYWGVNGVSITGALGMDQVDFSGSTFLPRRVGSIQTARNALTITNYTLRDITLTCEFAGEVFAEFYVFLYRKLAVHTK